MFKSSLNMYLNAPGVSIYQNVWVDVFIKEICLLMREITTPEYAFQILPKLGGFQSGQHICIPINDRIFSAARKI